MAAARDLDRIADLCKAGAKATLDALLALGPKPDAEVEAFLWEQRSTRLQGQLNSLSALVSKLTAAAVIEALKGFDDELKTIGKVAETAEKKIERIAGISAHLTAMARVLDLGLAVLSAAAAPTAANIAAALAASDGVAEMA